MVETVKSRVGPPQVVPKEEIFPYLWDNWQEAGKKRDELRAKLLELAGFPSMEAFLKAVAPETAVVFIHAGCNTCWQQSIADPNNQWLVSEFQIDHKRPQGLTEVPNYLPGIDGEKIPLAAYNVFSVQRIVENEAGLVVIHRGQKKTIERKILRPLGLESKAFFAEQNIDPKTAKSLSYADALRQAVTDREVGKLIRKSKYVITCFAGPPNRRRTVEESLLAMYVADKFRLDVSVLLPTTVLPDGDRYPIYLDDQGYPVGNKHLKLSGQAIETAGNPNNIGFRVYKTEDLIKCLEEIDKLRKNGQTYSQIFPGLEEFGLDNIDSYFMGKRRAMILNVADPREILNGVETLPQIDPRLKDIRAMIREDFELKPLTSEEFSELAKRLREKLQGYNIVIIDPHPDKARCGAGHSRQALAMKRFLEELGLQEQVTHISLEDVGGLAAKFYPYLQATPWLYNTFDKLLEELSKLVRDPKKFDFLLRKAMDRTDEVKYRLGKSPHFNPKNPTIFIATHVSGAIAAAQLINSGVIKGALVEYPPDPWSGYQLKAMTSPVIVDPKKGEHLVVVHDQATAKEYREIRRELPEEQVLPLGTLSAHEFITGKISTPQGFTHIGIEFSGNRLPSYEKKVLAIIKEMADDLKTGKIRLTIHTMWHTETKRKINKLLEELGLSNNLNIRIIHTDPSEENYAEKALRSRQDYITGIDEAGWGRPDVVISKGGEVPIEDRNQMLVAVIYGEGHERADAEVGVKERRALNLIDYPALEIWQKIKEEIEKRKTSQLPPPPPSLALLAPLALFDTAYLLRGFMPIET